MYGNNDYRDYVIASYESENHLEHFGIKGQKWGVRRYQNPDGTLTEDGKLRLKKYKNDEGSKINRDIIKTKEKMKRPSPDFVYNIRKQKLERLKEELKIVNKMKFSDMEKEKRLVGFATTAAVLGSIGSVPLVSSVMGAPAGILLVPNIKNIKSNYRLGNDRKIKTLNKRYKEIEKL